MYKLILLNIPEHSGREPDNYYSARMKVLTHYDHEKYWSEQDRNYYIFTKDSLEELVEKIQYIPSPNTKDCTFHKFELPLNLGMFPENASKWLEGQLASLGRLHSLYQQLQKGIGQE